MKGKKTEYVKAKNRVKMASGDVVRVACEMLDMSQAELARRSGIAESHISAIIAGKKPSGKVYAAKLAGALGISPGQILFAGTESRIGSNVAAALEKNAATLRAQKQEINTLLRGSLQLAKKMAHTTPQMRELLLKLERASQINQEEDITGFHVLAKKAFEDHKGHQKD